MTQPTHRDFFVRFLTRLELPVRTASLRALACVNIYENPQGNLRWWNPLAVSLPYNGSTPLYPDVPPPCAQLYNTFHDGVVASAKLYSGLHWTAVRAAIADYSKRGPILDAFRDAYTWPASAPHFDFRAAPFNTSAQLDARLAHPLYGPTS